MSSLEGKTEISALQELCVKLGLNIPHYELTTTSGPPFQYKVTVGDYVAFGTGLNKKQAKHNAAQSILPRIQGKHVDKPCVVIDSDSGESTRVRSTSGDSTEGSPVSPSLQDMSSLEGKTEISTLQELCVKLGLNIPHYELTTTIGPPFQYKVTVGDFVAFGTGLNKKQAKHNAAQSILPRIQGKHVDKPCAVIDRDNNSYVSTQAHSMSVDIIPESPESLRSPQDGSDVGKTQVGVLQELCFQRGLSAPQYELEKPDGPPFVYIARAADYTGTGEGSNKRSAKQKAAMAVLHQIQGSTEDSKRKMNEFKDIDELTPTVVRSLSVVSSPGSPESMLDSVTANAVGELQELAQKHSLPLPEYQQTSVSGPSHARLFTYIVRFNNLTETGISKSKKLAKHNAATAMLQAFCSTQVSSKPIKTTDKDMKEVIEKLDKCSLGSKDTTTIGLSSKISNFSLATPRHTGSPKPFAEPKPDDIQVPPGTVIDESQKSRLLVELSKLLGGEWYRCGLLLGIEPHTLNNIESNNNYGSRRALKMLLRWSEKCGGSEDQKVTLCQALEKVKRDDLVAVVNNPDDTLSVVLAKLPPHLVNVWEDLAVHLDMELYEVDAFSSKETRSHEECAMDMLRKWSTGKNRDNVVLL